MRAEPCATDFNSRLRRELGQTASPLDMLPASSMALLVGVSELLAQSPLPWVGIIVMWCWYNRTIVSMKLVHLKLRKPLSWNRIHPLNQLMRSQRIIKYNFRPSTSDITTLSSEHHRSTLNSKAGLPPGGGRYPN